MIISTKTDEFLSDYNLNKVSGGLDFSLQIKTPYPIASAAIAMEIVKNNLKGVGVIIPDTAENSNQH